VQVLDHVPMDDHDRHVDVVVTSGGTYYCSPTVGPILDCTGIND
jgi:hypothetical protein